MFVPRLIGAATLVTAAGLFCGCGGGSVSQGSKATSDDAMKQQQDMMQQSVDQMGKMGANNPDVPDMPPDMKEKMQKSMGGMGQGQGPMGGTGTKKSPGK